MAGGIVLAWGDNSARQCAVPPNLINVLAVAAGGFHSLALRGDRTIAGWGDNSFGQTTPPAKTAQAQSLAAGGFFSMALLTNGYVVAWGFGGNGQTNVPASVTNAIAIAGGFNHALALLGNGTVAAWGDNGSGQTSVPAGLSNVIAIAAGFNHSLALRADGGLVGWGSGARGQTAAPSTMTNLTGIAAGDSFNIGLTPAPVLRAQPAGQALVPGMNTTFNVTAISPTPIHYQWLKDGTNIPGAISAAFTLTNTQTSDGGNYSVIVSNQYGSIPSAAALLAPLPMLLSLPANRIAQLGGAVTFSTLTTSTVPVSYRWQFNDSAIPGATSSTYTRSDAQLAHAGGYQVIVSNGSGTVTSPPAWLFLVSSNHPINAGNSITLGITSPIPSAFQWQFSGVNLPGQTGATLELNNVQASQSGLYRTLADDSGSVVVVVTNVHGAVTRSLWRRGH